MSSKQNVSKYVIFAIFSLLFLLIIWPFLPSIILATIFAIVFNPLYRFFTKRLKWNKTLSALVVLLISLVFILTPLALLVGLVAKETIYFAQSFNQEAFLNFISNYSMFSFFGYEIDISAYTGSILSALQNAGQAISGHLVAFGSNLVRIAFLFFVFLFVYFYFLRDGAILVSRCRYLLPFTQPQNRKLLNDFYNTSKTVFVGYVISAFLSGISAYIAFELFGIPGAVIWALLAGLLSFIPTIGTIVVYTAGLIIVSFTVGLPGFLGLLAYYIIIEIVLLQSIVRPKLVDEKITIHPILVFFSLVGGVTVFGSIGIIYGPLIMVMFVSIFDFITGTSHAQK